MTATEASNRAAGSPILFLLNSLRIGGSETKTIRLANALDALGVPVHIAYLNGPATLRDTIDPRVPVITLNRAGKFSLAAARRLAIYLRANGIRRVLCVNLYPALYAFTARKMPDCPQFALSVTINTSVILSRKDKFWMQLYAPLLRRADKVIFGCKFQQGEWMARYNLPQQLCTYIYNGVDVDHFSPRAVETDSAAFLKMHRLGPTLFTVGSVGQMRPEKSHVDLIEAISRIRDRHKKVAGLLVGDGPERRRVEAEVQKRRLGPHFLMTGELRDVRPALAAMNVFVLTSVAVETFSNAALEAMAMGLPVIITRIGGAAEMVEDGENGFLFDRGDISALTERLDLLIQDPELCERMAAKARCLATERFAMPRMIKNYRLVLDGLG